MAVLQKRITELDTYTQEASGHEDYIDPATIYFAVDHATFEEAKKMNVGELLFANHIEAGAASVVSVDIEVTYGAEFTTGAIPLLIQAYKVVAVADVGDVYESVPYHDLTPTAAGFTLTLSEYVDVIVKYFAFE